MRLPCGCSRSLWCVQDDPDKLSPVMTRREWLQTVPGAAVLAAQADAQETVVDSSGPKPKELLLSAGPLTMLFEPDTVFLRQIRMGDREVLRGIYAAVRDRNWGTVTPRIQNLSVQVGPDNCQLEFEVVCQQGPIDFSWQGTIKGNAQGEVRFEFDGKARSAFLRNRVGFCVLHPVRECAGQPVQVGTTDGHIQTSRFPDLISPQQPFMNMRSITHQVTPAVDAEVRFEGDVFEMEDQRNWTDGSYKTYCTPLALPFPKEVQAGERIRQVVQLRLLHKASAAGLPGARASEAPLTLSLGQGAPGRLPSLGVGLAQGMTIGEAQAARLRALKLAHLRADLRLADADIEQKAREAFSQAALLQSPLELALTWNGDPAALMRVQQWLAQAKPKVARIFVFHEKEKATSRATMQAAAPLRQSFTGSLGAGTNAYFTELNRERPDAALMDVITYSVNPQVHAFDNRSLVETLETQGDTLRSARAFCGGKPLAVSPVTLKPRFNPNATGSIATGSQSLPETVDSRQPSLFAAAWTTGSIKYLAENGAAAVTYFETVGWKGLMETDAGSSLPDRFASRPGQVFALYHVIADVQEWAGANVLPSHLGDPLRAEALVLQRGAQRRVLLANLTPVTQSIRLPAWAAGAFVRVLDQGTLTEAALRPSAFRTRRRERLEGKPAALRIVLQPYATACLDCSAKG